MLSRSEYAYFIQVTVIFSFAKKCEMHLRIIFTTFTCSGIRQHRGKGLAAFLKAIGYIIPLMDASYANYYTKEVMTVVIREFQSPDEEMKKIVLTVVKQCVATDGVDAAYVKEAVLPEFFRHFWVRRMALDRRNYKQVVETTVELANKVGCAEVLSRIVDDLKDEVILLCVFSCTETFIQYSLSLRYEM